MFLPAWRHGPEGTGGVIIQGRPQARVAAFPVRGLVEVLALTAVYLLAARVALLLAADESHICPVWLPSGVALGGLLLLGVSRWPAVALGAGVVSYAMGVSPGVGLSVVLGSTLEAVLAALLFRRMEGARELHRVRDVVWLGAGAGLGA
ncbi:histidine kinase, partial [Corallococcus exercitus]